MINNVSVYSNLGNYCFRKEELSYIQIKDIEEYNIKLKELESLNNEDEFGDEEYNYNNFASGLDCEPIDINSQWLSLLGFEMEFIDEHPAAVQTYIWELKEINFFTMEFSFEIHETIDHFNRNEHLGYKFYINGVLFPRKCNQYVHEIQIVIAAVCGDFPYNFLKIQKEFYKPKEEIKIIENKWEDVDDDLPF